MASGARAARQGLKLESAGVDHEEEADDRRRGAVIGPLDLVDHEARARIGEDAGTLADRDQPDQEGDHADDEQPAAHDAGLTSLRVGIWAQAGAPLAA